MPLKLLQVEQSKIITCILQKKGIVLNNENNNKWVLDNIAKKDYTHVFTSYKIALLKRFKNSVLDHIALLYLLLMKSI